MTENTVSINDIMADIKAAAAEMDDTYISVPHELGALDADWLYALQSEIRGYIHTLVRTKDCTAIKPVVSARGGVIGAADVIVKRLIRKLTLWLVEPAWKQQKVYNIALTAAVSRMAEINEELMKGLVYLSKELDGMRENSPK